MRIVTPAVAFFAAFVAVSAPVRAEHPDDDAAPVLTPPAVAPGGHAHPPYPVGADGGPARVRLRLTIDREGQVSNAVVLSNDRAGDAGLPFERGAVDYVRGLRFEPATRDGQPVTAQVTFEVFFDPDEGSTDEGEESSPTLSTTQASETSDAPPTPGSADPPASFSATAVVPVSDLSASSIELTGQELRLRPYLSTGDLLNAVPGVYSIQHAGGGKANQYFLRGFDADHGTDIAFYVDGIPINAVSHGHGQGYTDLHFVIPELIDRIEVNKGPYFAEYGDFSTAGTINMVLDSAEPTSSFSFLGGTYRTYRGVGIVSPDTDRVRPLLAVDVLSSDGPFDNPEDQLRFNLFARTTLELGRNVTLALTGTAYGNSWNASGQIPLREVEAGRLDRFGSLDTNEGGESYRLAAYLNLSAPARAGLFGRRSVASEGLQLVGWVARSSLELFSNFTFFSRDRVDGDMIRQGDLRTTFGTRAGYGFAHRFNEVALKTRFGTNLRVDLIDNSLDDAPAREIREARVDTTINQTSVGLYVEEELSWRWLRAVGSIRGDFFNFDVTDRLSLGPSRDASQSIWLPKASLILRPVEQVQLFFNVGRGFHSNDARGVVRAIDPATPLAAAFGWEVGARVLAWDRLELSTVFFWLDLESEVVWIGDEGTTEESGSSRRFGLEFQVRAELTKWLLADFDASWVDARLLDAPAGENAIPLAPDLLISGGLTAFDPKTGISGRLGAFYLADRPATEDRFLTAEGFVRVDLSVGWENDRFGLKAQVLNLLNTQWRQAQFATTGRLREDEGPGDCPAGTRAVVEDGTFVGCEDIHFTPGWPIHVQVMATVKF
ncbi:MAG: TonB-dependent receptor [Myxococcota bacterium]